MSEADKKKKAADYTYEPESGEGDYYISERPWAPKCFGKNSHAIKIRVEHATKYTMTSMGKRYCFAFGNFIKVEYEKYKGMSLKSNYLSPYGFKDRQVLLVLFESVSYYFCSFKMGTFNTKRLKINVLT